MSAKPVRVVVSAPDRDPLGVLYRYPGQGHYDLHLCAPASCDEHPPEQLVARIWLDNGQFAICDVVDETGTPALHDDDPLALAIRWCRGMLGLDNTE